MIAGALTPLLAQGLGDFVQNRAGATSRCPGNNGFCPGWIADNFDRYTGPLLQHVALSTVPLIIGFLIAFALALLAHRFRPLGPPLLVFVSVLFTIPSIALFLILINILPRGYVTAAVALIAYAQVLVFRNVTTGLDEVPKETVEAAEGMGLTSRQILFKVEVPMALPTILAGLRIAASSTVGIAGFAYYGGAGGLGTQIFAQPDFKGNVVICSLLMILLAAALEAVVLVVQRLLTPWSRAGVA